MNEASTLDASPAKAEVALTVRRSRRQAWALGLGALLCLALLAVSLALPRLERLFLQRLGTEAEATQTLVREVLRGELDRAAPLPALMAERPILRQVLAEPENQGLLPFVNEQLRQSAMALDVSHIYLLDRTGRTVASSNYRSELSFVGRNFGYRPYFTRALAGEPARFHAVGTTTGQRGYFFAAPVIEGLEIVGVLAVKVTLDGFEENWRQGAYSVLVTDSNDVVFLSDRIDWHLALIDTLSEEGRAEITRTRQYPLAQLRGLDLERAPLSDSLDEVSIASGAPEGGAQHYVAHTGLIAAVMPEKPDGAWTSAQCVDYLFTRVARGDFYILCPDNMVNEAIDARRVLWSAGDIVENRPALSRWHPEWAETFSAFEKG